jgi:predicted branched-subunit amino acid permease
VPSKARPAPRLRDGLFAALPLVPGPILFGLSFGVFAEGAGMGAVAAVVMSGTTFGGAAWPILAGAGLLLYVLLVSSTAVGTVGGGTLADPESLGLDAAFAALFLGLAVPYVRGRKALQAAALAAVITLALLPMRLRASRSSRRRRRACWGCESERRLDRGARGRRSRPQAPSFSAAGAFRRGWSPLSR